MTFSYYAPDPSPRELGAPTSLRATRAAAIPQLVVLAFVAGVIVFFSHGLFDDATPSEVALAYVEAAVVVMFSLTIAVGAMRLRRPYRPVTHAVLIAAEGVPLLGGLALVVSALLNHALSGALFYALLTAPFVLGEVTLLRAGTRTWCFTHFGRGEHTPAQA